MDKGTALAGMPTQDLVALSAQEQRKSFVRQAQEVLGAKGRDSGSLSALQGLLGQVHARFGDRQEAIEALGGAIASGNQTPKNLSMLGQNLGMAMAYGEVEPEQAAETLAHLDLDTANRREVLLACVDSCSTADSNLHNGFVPALRMAEATFARAPSAQQRGEVEGKLQAAFCVQGRSRLARRQVQKQLLPQLRPQEATLYQRWLGEAARADRRQNLKSLLSTDRLLAWGVSLGLVVGLLAVATPLAVAQGLETPVGLAFSSLAMGAPVLAGVALLAASLCAGLVVTVAVPYLLYAFTPLGLSR